MTRIAPDPAPGEMAEIAVEHYEGLLGLYGEKTGVRHARKHLAAYAEAAMDAGFAVSGALRTALVTSEEPRTVVSLLRSLYASLDREAA